MSIKTIHEDSISVFIKHGNSKIRPLKPHSNVLFHSSYTKGMKVYTHHFGGSTTHGVGKKVVGKKLGRSDYDEYWRDATDV